MPIHFLSTLLLLTGAFFLVTATMTAFTTSRTKFKAAVYEHNVIAASSDTVMSRPEALAHMEKNLAIYSEQVKLAKEQDADIIVFPEDGIYGVFFTREAMYPFLEEVPDPQLVTWSPCQDPTRYNNTEVQHSLSCMASQQLMYLVAIMGSKESCDVTLDPECPPDGRYQYNTAVAFGPDGRLLARYRKANLFPDEEQFDAAKMEHIYFDSPFGRFGLLICFDIFKYDPAFTLVTQHQVANIIFCTTWLDALPLLSALGFHSSFARAWGVNFLAANNHNPQLTCQGSGMYSPNGMKAFHYNNSLSSPPKLIVTELDVLDKPKPPVSKAASPLDHKYQCKMKTTQPGQTDLDASEIENNCKVAPLPLILDIHESSISSSDVFYGTLFDDNFKFLEVDGVSGNKSICSKSKKVCCHLDYAKADTILAKGDEETDLFAFGVFDGLHTLHFDLYFQICALVRCADSHNRSSCGAETTTSNTAFKKIEIRGTFETQYVFPQVLLYEPPSGLKLAEPHAWSYDGKTLLTNSEMQSPVLSAALFGRDFSRDNSSSSNTSS